MASQNKAPFFSIIISTRNRPEQFQTALLSVLDQSFSDREIIVVIDGSTDSNLRLYRELMKDLDQVTFYELEHRQNGHGQSYAGNQGANRSSGQYLCFLDDDDFWTDNGYLEEVFDNISACKLPVDVHYSNQTAVYYDGVSKKGGVWIDDLIPKVKPHYKNHGDSYFVDIGFLLSSRGFAHLNCSVFKREFYLSVGGMDENIRYENDRDIYIRSIDVATVILFSTNYISLHNIPDPSKKSNMSTASSEIEKKLDQLRVYDKGISLSKNGKMVRFCCMAKMYELKHATRILAKCKRHRSAAYYAKEALINGFNFSWLAYTLYLTVLAWIKPNNVSEDSFQ